MQYTFFKMNGSGNDFVVFDARKIPVVLNADQIRKLASRDNRVTNGCDQLIIMEPSKKADIFMRIYNADGGQVDACGNATRCIGSLIMEETDKQEVSVETNAGILTCRMYDHEEDSVAAVEANMGTPYDAWQDIPLGGDYNRALLIDIANQLGIPHVTNAVCIGMGNPHVVFFAESLPTLAIMEAAGKKIAAREIDLFKTNGINLTVAMLDHAQRVIFSRVYERGAGITKSCGTAACATAVAAIKLGYRKQDANIAIQQWQPDIVELTIRWESKSHNVLLIGPVQREFEGVVEL